MDTTRLQRITDVKWQIEPQGEMRVPGIIYATEELLRNMDDKVAEQLRNVAKLPGIVSAAYAMPDAHWGYGFPIGGVAAFDPDEGGVVSAGGVGFDISCGVRTVISNLTLADVERDKQGLADALYRAIPSGVGSKGRFRLDRSELDAMLAGGARWAVERGFGFVDDLERTEESGQMPGALPEQVSDHAKQRQRDEMGTLGSGNHYLEVQHVVEVSDQETAVAFGLQPGSIVVSIHCGSRGLGHQIGTEFLKAMVLEAIDFDLRLPDKELACAPIRSTLGAAYLGAMRAGINCALANRQIITHLAREVFAEIFPGSRLSLLYDVSHNTCKVERHSREGQPRSLFVHRKGATRAFGPGHGDLPEVFRHTGQPVLIGGTMGTASYILVGTKESEAHSFSSACHGAGRAMSRRRAKKQWRGDDVVRDLAQRGIVVRSVSKRGVAEEAPRAYKDVGAVVAASHQASLARTVARLEPLVCIKG